MLTFYKRDKNLKKVIMMRVLQNLVGKKRFQKFFNPLFRLSLRGLNYGNGGNFEESGELHVLKYVNDRFRREKLLTIFDVGGNVGNYSRTLSEFFSTRALIHSFEPSKKTYEIFLETTKGIKHIIPNNFGFSDNKNSQLLYTDIDGSGLASIYRRNLEHHGILMHQSEEIKLSTIDAYSEVSKINRIHFLKLDIEGHELKALKGAARMINEKKVDVIQFEFGGCNIDSRTYFQDFFYLLRDNFRIYRILKDGLLEMPTYQETQEIFININYLAVKK
jgi:FkbM family methyltransferase